MPITKRFVSLTILVFALPVVIFWLLVLLPDAEAQSTRRLVTVLDSDGRITHTTSSDFTNIQENLNVSAGYFVLNVSAVDSGAAITPAIQIKDPVSGVYQTILTATTQVTTVGTFVYLVGTGLGTAANDVTQVASFPLAPTWRVGLVHSDTTPITYSIGALLID